MSPALTIKVLLDSCRSSDRCFLRSLLALGLLCLLFWGRDDRLLLDLLHYRFFHRCWLLNWLLRLENGEVLGREGRFVLLDNGQGLALLLLLADGWFDSFILLVLLAYL